MSGLLVLLVGLFSPVPCTDWELNEDASLFCDGSDYPVGSFVLVHDPDDGEIMAAKAWRSTCDTVESGPCDYFEFATNTR